VGTFLPFFPDTGILACTSIHEPYSPPYPTGRRRSKGI
jgi:hypothetical protein